MKNIWCTILIAILATGFYASAQKGSEKNKVLTQKEKQNKPDVRTIVNRRYDEKGNLIGYDSTYTWSYMGTDKSCFNEVDSLFNQFKRLGFGTLGLGSRGVMDSFYNENLSRLKNADPFIRHIDSIQKAFLNKHFTEGELLFKRQPLYIDNNVL